MLELVIGEKRNAVAADELVNLLKEAQLTGSFYVGYPILAAVEETLIIDALLITKEHGLVIFDLGGLAEDAADRQNDMHAAVNRKLRGLVDKLSVTLSTITNTSRRSTARTSVTVHAILPKAGSQCISLERYRAVGGQPRNANRGG